MCELCDRGLEPGTPEWEEYVRAQVSQPNGEQWMWLSFVDPDAPPSNKFLGVAIVPGTNVIQASHYARVLGCNPGGEVAAWPMPDIEKVPMAYRLRLLNTDELAGIGFETKSVGEIRGAQ